MSSKIALSFIVGSALVSIPVLAFSPSEPGSRGRHGFIQHGQPEEVLLEALRHFMLGSFDMLHGQGVWRAWESATLTGDARAAEVQREFDRIMSDMAEDDLADTEEVEGMLRDRGLSEAEITERLEQAAAEAMDRRMRAAERNVAGRFGGLEEEASFMLWIEPSRLREERQWSFRRRGGFENEAVTGSRTLDVVDDTAYLRVMGDGANASRRPPAENGRSRAEGRVSRPPVRRAGVPHILPTYQTGDAIKALSPALLAGGRAGLRVVLADGQGAIGNASVLLIDPERGYRMHERSRYIHGVLRQRQVYADFVRLEDGRWYPKTQAELRYESRLPPDVIDALASGDLDHWDAAVLAANIVDKEIGYERAFEQVTLDFAADPSRYNTTPPDGARVYDWISTVDPANPVVYIQGGGVTQEELAATVGELGETLGGATLDRGRPPAQRRTRSDGTAASRPLVGEAVARDEGEPAAADALAHESTPSRLWWAAGGAAAVVVLGIAILARRLR